MGFRCLQWLGEIFLEMVIFCCLVCKSGEHRHTPSNAYQATTEAPTSMAWHETLILTLKTHLAQQLLA